MFESVAVTVAETPLRTRSSVTTVSPLPASTPVICVPETRVQLRLPAVSVLTSVSNTIVEMESEPWVKVIVPAEVTGGIAAGELPFARFWSSTVSEIGVPAIGLVPSMMLIACAALDWSPSPSVIV